MLIIVIYLDFPFNKFIFVAFIEKTRMIIKIIIYIYNKYIFINNFIFKIIFIYK